MKTKFTVEIHKSDSELDSLSKMIGNHNSGVYPLELRDIQGYLKCRSSLWLDNGPYETTFYGGALEVWRGGNPIVTITLKEVYELSKTEADLLTQEKLS